jgi:hypothetical protein
MIGALRGEVTEAELTAHEEALAEMSDRQLEVTRRVPRLQADVAGGRWEDIEPRCLELVPFDRISGTAYVFLAGRVAIWRRDREALLRLIDRHEGLRVHGQAMSAERVTMHAALAALEGRTTDAHMGYREALDRWRDLGLEWDEAMMGLEMATVLDQSEPDVAAAMSRSREIFVRVRARPFLERLAATQGAALRPVPQSGESIAVSAAQTSAPD